LKKPLNWDDFVALSSDPAITSVMRVRLIEIAFSESGSVAVKAIELLSAMPPPDNDVDLTEVPTEVLLEAERRARDYLEKLSADE
jgi:hypothetical protein